MKNRDTISVIIPAFNARKFIHIPLDSLKKQTIPLDEIIIVDDGSQDDTYSYVRKFYPWVRIIRTLNRGVSHARNIGIKSASSSYICFLDADDEWDVNASDNWRKAISKYKNAKVIVSNFSIGNWNNRAYKVLYRGILKNPLELFTQKKILIWTGSICLHKTVLNNIGGFDEDLSNGEDLDLWLRVLMSDNKIAIIDCIQSKYNVINPNSITSTAAKLDFWKREMLAQKYFEFTKNSKVHKVYIDNYFYLQYLEYYFSAYVTNDKITKDLILQFVERYGIRKPNIFNAILHILKTKLFYRS